MSLLDVIRREPELTVRALGLEMKPYLIKMSQKCYLDHCGQVNGHTALAEASGWGCSQAVKILLDAKASVNQHSSRDASSPLCRAAGSGHAELVSSLIASGARIAHISSCTGRGPLHHAAAAGHLAVVEALLARSDEIEINAAAAAGD